MLYYIYSIAIMYLYNYSDLNYINTYRPSDDEALLIGNVHGPLRVTDRNISLTRFPVSMRGLLQEIPIDGVFLELGAGTNATTAQVIKFDPYNRPDLSYIGLDPSLAIPSKKIFDGEILVERYFPERMGTCFVYHADDSTITEHGHLLHRFNAGALHEGRVHKAISAGSKPWINYPNIPIENDSVDFILELFGPSTYTSSELDNTDSIEARRQYLVEILRILKPGGRALIYPLTSDESFFGSSEDFFIYDESMPGVNALYEAILPNDSSSYKWELVCRFQFDETVVLGLYLEKI